jgi:superfamily II DNA or RNA helicase
MDTRETHMTLRPYQQEALAALKQSIGQGVRRIMLGAPTGAGKTEIAAAIVDGALQKGNRVAFVVPAISLVDQTVERFWQRGIRDVGVIQANHSMTDWSRPVQVCSIQTLASRRTFPEAQVVVFDEAHMIHEAHRTWLADPAWRGVPFVGLSATPWSKGLGRYFESLIPVTTTQALIDQGYLSPFKVFATGHPDLRGVKTVAGDYHEGELSAAMRAGSLTADIIDTWIARHNGAKTLVFAVDRAHAKALQSRFEAAGVPAGYQDAHTSDTERREIRRKFHTGEFRVVSNVGTLTTGVDWDVRCLVLARPTKSEILYTQIIGRVLRTAPGKDFALILDHSDTTQRLGFVTDIHHDELDKGERTKAPRILRPKECPRCAALRLPRLSECPNCGFKPEPVSGVVEQTGELWEITSGKLPQRNRKARRLYTEGEKI